MVPLVGPSSILMSVMGRALTDRVSLFTVILPIDASERTNTIKKLEGRIYSEHQTQLFIETPYRNNKLAEELDPYVPSVYETVYRLEYNL